MKLTEKKTIYLTAILFLSVFMSTGLMTQFVHAGKKAVTDEKKTENITVVEVNNVKLTETALEKDIASKLTPYKNRFPADKLLQIKAQMRDRLIDDFIIKTIIKQESEKHKISVSKKEVDSKIEDITQGLPKGTTLSDALKRNGISEEDLRKQIKFGLMSDKLFESQVKYATTPTEEEIAKYYKTNKKQFDTPETVHARHILVKINPNDNETAQAARKAKAEKIRKDLLGGADFAKMAGQKSDCPSKAQGGDLGTFKRGSMVKPFEDAAFSQEPDKIGPVIKTRFGYHIIQVLEHNAAQTKSLKDAKLEISEKLIQSAKEKAVRQYLSQLREKAKIVYGKTEKK
jgi:parvulin-like peptidyl-prolyl isomerase